MATERGFERAYLRDQRVRGTIVRVLRGKRPRCDQVWTKKEVRNTIKVGKPGYKSCNSCFNVNICICVMY